MHAAMDQGPRRELDVRPLLARGEEPYRAIMAAVDELAEDEALVLRSPFEPTPLHRVLGGLGFDHAARERGPDDWETVYRRRPAQEAGDGPVALDVRGLEPPEPMERTLAALDELPEGRELLQINDRVPAFLLPLLDERGYRYRVARDDRGTLVTIWRDEPA
jgi:uncharacterized protein (DUF2249 family)